MISRDVIKVINSNITVGATEDRDTWATQKDRREWVDLLLLAINCLSGNTANTLWSQFKNAQLWIYWLLVGFHFCNGGQNDAVTKFLPMCGCKPLVLCRLLVYFLVHYFQLVSPLPYKNMRGVIPVGKTENKTDRSHGESKWSWLCKSGLNFKTKPSRNTALCCPEILWPCDSIVFSLQISPT